MTDASKTMGEFNTWILFTEGTEGDQGRASHTKYLPYHSQPLDPSGTPPPGLPLLLDYHTDYRGGKRSFVCPPLQKSHPPCLGPSPSKSYRRLL